MIKNIPSGTLSIYILIRLKLLITAMISDETESKVLWLLDSSFIFYVNMETATFSSFTKEI